MKMTKGEYRVGISFNPSNNGKVDQIKRMAADLIDLIETIPATARDDNTEGGAAVRSAEVGRLKSLAQTNVEDAAMWAVKAATKPAPEEFK
jgi:hypothetical protein